MSKQATLTIGDKDFPLNILVGTEDEHAIDISTLRKESKYITFDDGYGNTGSCESDITFIDGDKGILRYRGYDISELAEKSSFLETCYLLIYGNLPSSNELSSLKERVSQYTVLPPEVISAIKALPANTHPMAVVSCGL